MTNTNRNDAILANRDAEHQRRCEVLLAAHIGDRFVALLLSDLGAGTMREIASRNALETSPDVCHSHDFLDANMVMAQAFGDCGVANDPESIDEALWARAWNHAVAVMARDHGRPAFDPTGLPEAVVARAVEKAAASWCYVTPAGGTFYVSESKARGMLARYGDGFLFPPEA
jgi:hypothetical protein